MYDSVNSSAEKKVHQGAYVLYFVGALNLALMLGVMLFGEQFGLQPSRIEGTALALAIGESILYLVLGYFAHQKHSTAALVIGALLLVADGIYVMAQMAGGAAEAVDPSVSGGLVGGTIGGLIMRGLFLLLLIRAIMASREAPAHS